MSFYSIFGDWSLVMDIAQEKMILGKRIKSKSWLFLRLKAIFIFYMISINENGHAKSINIDFEIENMSYLSPNDHNLV